MPSANEYSLLYTHLCNPAPKRQRRRRRRRRRRRLCWWRWWCQAIRTIWVRFKTRCARHFFLIFMHSHSEHKTHLIWQTTTVSGSSQKHPVPLRSHNSSILAYVERSTSRLSSFVHGIDSEAQQMKRRKFFLLRRSLAMVTETNRCVADAQQAARRRWKTKLK